MSLFGGLLSAVAGPIIGGLFGRSNAKYSQKLADRSDAAKLQRMVADADAAGINRYAALQAGAGSSGAGPGPRVVSDTAWVNAFDKIDDVLSGRQAERDRQMQLNNELARISIDEARRGAETYRSPRVGTVGPQRLPGGAGTDPASTGSEIAELGLGDQLAEVGPVTVTNTGRLDEDFFPDFRLADVETTEARRGETPELISMLNWPLRWQQDRDFNYRVHQTAESLGISPNELYDRLREDPTNVDAVLMSGLGAMAQQGTGFITDSLERLRRSTQSSTTVRPPRVRAQ
jgi:hypothetical protein